MKAPNHKDTFSSHPGHGSAEASGKTAKAEVDGGDNYGGYAGATNPAEANRVVPSQAPRTPHMPRDNRGD